MKIPALPQCHNVLIVAPVSSGKSWLMQQWINSVERSINIDVTSESMDASYHHIWHSPQALAQRLKENPHYYRIAYHPSSRNFFEDFRWCVDLLWIAKPVAPRWLFVDEIHEVCSTSSITEEMDRIIRYARHIKIGFMGATQKFSDVPTLMRDNTRMMVIFHNTDDIELKSIRGKFGKEGETIVRNLRPLVYDEETEIVHQTPQCMVWTRSGGIKVYDLGDLVQSSEPVVNSTQIGEQRWQEENSQVPHQEEPAVSLAHPSGVRMENQSQDGLQDSGTPK